MHIFWLNNSRQWKLKHKCFKCVKWSNSVSNSEQLWKKTLFPQWLKISVYKKVKNQNTTKRAQMVYDAGRWHVQLGVELRRVQPFLCLVLFLEHSCFRDFLLKIFDLSFNFADLGSNLASGANMSQMSMITLVFLGE